MRRRTSLVGVCSSPSRCAVRLRTGGIRVSGVRGRCLPLLLTIAGILLGLDVRLAAAPADEASLPSVASLIADADELGNRGFYTRAADLYEQVLDRDADAPAAILGIARGRLATGQYEQARDWLLDHAGLFNRSDPDAAPAPTTQTKSDIEWHLLLAKALRSIGQYDPALDHLRAAVELDGDNPKARYLLAAFLEYRGRRADALEVYTWFNDQLTRRGELQSDAEWLTYTGMGFLRDSVLSQTEAARRTQHVLQQMYQAAYTRVDRTYWPARIAAADLLRSKFNNDDFDGSVSDYQAALRINGTLAEAHVGLGAVALESWQFEEVDNRVQLALATNPRFAPALHLHARKWLFERRFEKALNTCDRALATNPNDVIALSLKAAAYTCLYQPDKVAELRQHVFAIHPDCAAFHAIVGEASSGMRQYAAAERELLEAVRLDPTDVNQRTELGMMYMQWGYEDKARSTLAAAWALDHYNERTKFMLDLLDRLQRFAATETEHFIVRYDETTDPGLGPYVGQLVENMYPEITGDFDAPMPRKTIIEMFPTHKAFGVRITGRPWISTVGACTGYVIAMDSPRRDRQLDYGPYNIASVLRHEFTHTVTLAATENRIAHWYTEGLAVFEEIGPRNWEWTQLLADAARRDELFTLHEIDWGFMRPKKATDRSQAYAQSEWMVEYIVERFGYGMLNAMLRAFRDGKRMPDVCRELFNLEPEEFDQAFKTWARKQAAGWGFDMTPPADVQTLQAQVEAARQIADDAAGGEDHPAAESTSVDAGLLGRLAKAEFDAGLIDKALQTAKLALAEDPAELRSLQVFAEVYSLKMPQEGDKDQRAKMVSEVKPVLQRLAERDPDHWLPPEMLGAIALMEHDQTEAIKQFKKLQRLCPMNPRSWQALSGVYLKNGEDDKALPQLRELARRSEHDAEVPAELGRIYSQQGNLKEAMYWYAQALHIDTFGVDVRKKLAATATRAGDTERALQEYELLTRIKPEEAEHFEQAAFAAFKLGQKDRAQRYARRAVELDPQSSAKSILQEAE